MNTFKLPDETHVSRVHLRTPNLGGVLEFYQKVLGLRVIDSSESEASLSATESTPAILGFTEARNANPRLHPEIGLYHFALRFPTRRDLAQAFLRVVAADYPIDGTSDHGMQESIYLSDPDGNGMELTADQRSLTSNRLKKRNPSEGA
jgi:catechol 2,3-dioxygenase